MSKKNCKLCGQTTYVSKLTIPNIPNVRIVTPNLSVVGVRILGIKISFRLERKVVTKWLH